MNWKIHLPALLCTAVLTLGTCCPKNHVKTHPIVTEKELFITAHDVVESDQANKQDGVWHIKHLFSQMARTNDPSQFALAWLRTWETQNTVNDLPQPPRTGIRDKVINPWKVASNMAGKPDEQTTLDFSKAPFRLLAIVYRPDLVATDAAGKVVRAGEGRFIFNVLNGTNASSFNIILEYELPGRDACDIQTWAERWHALSHPDNDRPKYLRDLATLTETFAGSNRKLHQLRSNEIELDGPWQLREWNLNEMTLRLEPVTVKQTPHLGLNGTETLKQFVAENTVAINDGSLQMPAQYQGKPFLGSLSEVSRPWNIPGVPPTAPLWTNFTVLTCNGCHKDATGVPFVHLSSRNIGEESRLHGFLTSAPFNDLLNRKRELEKHLGVDAPGRMTLIAKTNQISILPPNRGSRVH